MSNKKHLDLVDVFRIIVRKKWFILIFAICAAVVGLIFCLVSTEQYTSSTVFIVKTPMNMDRNQVIRRGGGYQINKFFATENDIDNVMTISKNEQLLYFLVDSFNLIKYYGVSTRGEAYHILKRRFKVTRNDNRSIEFDLSDADPKMASTLVNVARERVDKVFHNYFVRTKDEFATIIKENIKVVNQQIGVMEDTILAIRKRYGLYKFLLPSRGYKITPSPASPGKGKTAGLEELFDAITQKDNLVTNRANYVALINEYKLEARGDKIKMFYTVQKGWPSETISFPKKIIILPIAFVAGLIFAAFLVVISASVRKLEEG